MKKLTLKINIPGLMKGLKKDSLVVIDVDDKGIPMNYFWWKRLRDSKIDNCVSIVQENKEIKITKKKKK